MSKFLVCAATRTETEAVRAGIRNAGLRNPGLEERFDILKTGIGPVNAAMRVREHLHSTRGTGQKYQGIISTGFSGSWSAQLGVGSWIHSSKVVNEQGDELESLGEIKRVFPQTHPSAVVSTDEILEAPPAPLLDQLSRRYGAGIPIAVDMESFALAGEAQEYEIPFMILRYITDSPEQPLPSFVREFTEVATHADPSLKIRSLFKGTRSLMSQPAKVAQLLRSGSAWRSDLAEGWERFALELVRV
jgi:nucleoside phosphorylase